MFVLTNLLLFFYMYPAGKENEEEEKEGEKGVRERQQ